MVIKRGITKNVDFTKLFMIIFIIFEEVCVFFQKIF